MMRLFTLCCALLVGLSLPVDNADAKRFGGGSSFGKSFFTQKKAAPTPKQTTTQQSTTQQSTAQTTTTAKPKPGMGGLFGGLLAGGLLGALFFGGAFEGIQMMDIIIVALLGFVLFRFLGRLKQPQHKPQYAGAGEWQPETAAPQTQPGNPSDAAEPAPTPLMSNGLAETELELPEWFDKQAFLDGAREHFITLQQAWNDNDLEQIRSYCDGSFFQWLEQERRQLGADRLDNEVVSVMAELLGFAEQDGEARLSINFYGWMREGSGADTTEFNEIWHLTRDLSGPETDWFIVGIEQPR